MAGLYSRQGSQHENRGARGCGQDGVGERAARRGRVIPSNDELQLNLVIKEPYGVVACIVPWNYPMLLLAWKLAPALAAGNTDIVKPSEMTPLTTCLFFEKCLDHLPPGVVNLVLGYGPDVAEPLVSHPDVPLIAFTGSLATGQRIASIAALMMKTLHLELGGKDAFVVEPDVDIENSVYAVAYAALINCGQVCTSTERVFIASEIAPRFTEAPTILSTRYTHPEFAKRKNKE